MNKTIRCTVFLYISLSHEIVVFGLRWPAVFEANCSGPFPYQCRVRELGFFSIMISGDTDLDRIKHISPKAIILSGGPNSVHEGTSPVLPAGFFEYTDSNSLPVLGICYGMQLIAHTLGGKVAPSPSGGEFGRMSMKTEPKSTLFSEEPSDTQTVWMSHGDDAVELPKGFVCAAKSMQVCMATSHSYLACCVHLCFRPLQVEAPSPPKYSDRTERLRPAPPFAEELPHHIFQCFSRQLRRSVLPHLDQPAW